jgi:hypothetical protein
MGKKKSTRRSGTPAGAPVGIPVGTPVRVRAGVTAPEFPEVSCGGWTGVVRDHTGPKAAPQMVVEWDAATLARIPPAYREQCEERNLLYTMSCFPESDLEPGGPSQTGADG